MVQETIGAPAPKDMILLIEDDPAMAHEITKQLVALGYRFEIIDDLELAGAAVQAKGAALLIADRLLHGTDSIALIEGLRDEGLQIPVLFVSALATVNDRIHGLKAGGDDYLAKPFAMGELAARIEALLRRANAGRAATLRVGPLKLDLIERRAWRDAREISLLPREFKLLEYMMRRPNQVITRTMLLEDLWKYRFVPQTNLVDVHIGKVRRKVDGPGEVALIRSVPRIGFMLDAAH